MFSNQTNEMVLSLLEDKYAELEDSIRNEVQGVVTEQGRPVWTRVGVRVRNNEIVVMVTHTKEQPSNCRSFSAGFVERPWELHA